MSYIWSIMFWAVTLRWVMDTRLDRIVTNGWYQDSDVPTLSGSQIFILSVIPVLRAIETLSLICMSIAKKPI